MVISMSMLDDFVEHAAGPSAPPRYAAPGIGGVDYEGFEVDDDEEMVEFQSGFVPSTLANLPSLFSLSLVQYSPPSTLLYLTSANSLLFLAAAPLSIIIIDLNKPEDLITIELPRPPPEKPSPSILKLFADPTARHLLITTTSGDTFYLPVIPGNPALQSRRPRPLRLKQTVTAVAWSPEYDETTTEVLLGSSTGQISSLPLPPQDDIFKSVSISMTKPVERDLQVVYTVPDGQAITGIGFGFWKSPKRAWVVISTKERLYEVQGNVTTKAWAEEVFKTVREGAPKFQELPGNPASSELKLYTEEPPALAWLTAPGLYSSPLSLAPSPDILLKPSLFPYPQVSGPDPISIAITQWHWLLLYPDRIVGVARESERVVWEEALPISGEKPIGLSADYTSKTFWVYTDRSILEILVRNEDRDVWKIKLEQGDFAQALSFATTPAQKDVILSRQGDAFFDQGRFLQAAQCYAKSTKSFEYVALRFVDADERDALRIYLSERLDMLDRKDLTQRMMLATWLVEIYLSKCNTLEDIVAAESATSDVESLNIERQMMEDDLRNFITTYMNDLDPKVVYELIQSHGRTDLYLFYAALNRDHGKVVEHWVTEENWIKAIDTLNRQTSLELYYRFASILMRHAPRETVDSWLRQTALSPRRLIPALLQPNARDQSIRYLTQVVHGQSSSDATIYNLLLTFYASHPDPDDSPLLRFLSSCPDDPITEKPCYDLDYALRLCKLHNRIQPCVLIYSKMGLFESSVDLALEKGDLELAKINADKPDDDEVLRKKLWLKIAKYVVQEKKDIKSAMKFLESIDLLKIEDILPFFPDFVVIDDFKQEICKALEDYSAHIEELKSEMDEATASAESIKRDIEGLANRFVTVEATDKCWKCGLVLVTRQFYVFPCQHVFHADCLISMAMELLPAPTLRRILHLQNELSPRPALSSSSYEPKITSGSATTDFLLGVTGRNKLVAAGDKLRELIIPDMLAQAVSVSVGGSVKKSKKERDREDGRSEILRQELDSLVAGVCPLCEGVVSSLDKPFIAEGEALGDWAI